jgi:two-component system phosphate regulon sensor histidine kinase PhoR
MSAQQRVHALPFTIAAAHELKAPLALIRQLSLALEQGGLSAAEEAKLLRQIILSSERGIRLTSDLTRTARLEDSLFELEPINSRQLCEEVAHELSPLYKAKNRELVVAGGKRQLLAVGNRDLLRRILINFSDNALHYADTAAPVVIRTSSLKSGEHVRVGVRDYGPAVPSDVWRRLSGHLGKAPQVLQNRPASSGLGLYISAQFAEAMQGSIGATRHRDGATFYVDLLASKQLTLL